MIHLQFAGITLQGLSNFKEKNRWKIQYLSEWIMKFHKLGKVSTTNQNSSWKLVS
jgi:hypothetical protein